VQREQIDMAGEREENRSPSRRALLKAAVAGGAFAVPLIASFSMDSASAHTKPSGFGSSNQVIITANMFMCSNMTYPTSAFFAELHRGSSPDVVGLAGFEFVEGREELRYELIFDGRLSNFIVSTPSGFLFEDETSGKAGTIPGEAFGCSDPMATVFGAFAAGGATIHVDLANGTTLHGTIFEFFDPLQGSSFRFIRS
jgi:hypothetical protein